MIKVGDIIKFKEKELNGNIILTTAVVNYIPKESYIESLEVATEEYLQIIFRDTIISVN